MPWPNAINLQDPPSRDDFLSHFWFRRFLVDGFSVAHGVSWGVLQSCGIPKSTWVSILNCLRWMIWEYSPILGNLHMRDWDHCKVSTFHCVLNARMRCIWIFHVNRRLLEDVGTNYTTVLYIWIWLNMVDYSPTPLFRLESDCEISQLIFLLFLFFCCNAMHKICVYIYIYTCVPGILVAHHMPIVSGAAPNSINLSLDLAPWGSWTATLTFQVLSESWSGGLGWLPSYNLT